MNLNEIHNSIIDNLSLLDIDNDEKRINHPTNIFESYANDEEYFLIKLIFTFTIIIYLIFRQYFCPIFIFFFTKFIK